MTGTPEKMTQETWLNASAQSFYEKLSLGYQLFGNRESAMSYATDSSCAGSRAREFAIARFEREVA